MEQAPSGHGLVAVLAAALAVVAWLLLVAQAFPRWLARRRHRRRMLRARTGEQEAVALLGRLGYRVLDAQVCAEYALSLDREPVSIAVRADYLVEREGRRFVAEVKTGAQATRIQTPATRRQLLEYRVAFDVDGVLLVDADSGRAHVVRFPFEGRPARSLRWVVLGCTSLALSLTLLIMKLFRG